MEQNIVKSQNELELLKRQVKKLENDNMETKEILKLKIAALEFSPNSILITNNSGNIIWVNKAFTKLTGYSLEEVIDKNPRVLKSGKVEEKIYKELWQTILSGKVWEGTLLNKKKDGSFYEDKQRITPVFNSKKEMLYFIATKQDITNQKKAYEALNDTYIKYEELSYIFNQSPAIGFLWVADKKRSVEFITDNIKQFGYTPEDFYSEGLTLIDIIYEKDKRRVKRELSKIIHEGLERFIQHYRIVDKREKYGG